MKKRVLVPIKILAFAFSTGCTSPEPVNAPQGVAPAEVTASAPPAPLPLANGDPNVNTLRAELARDKNALGRAEHYRPLCDKDGYPLVGNLNSKGHVEFEPSAICRAIREKANVR